ncbi:4-hydroxyphenylpyruvate dioxygenase [Streptomyces sp. NPDC007095]|uniref:4-hydroxyphenylpyruvate dioxygenase n=1 Tax=Streptomyces sp. NPDC007095 TaxID=3154482 RepID=UPI0033E8D42C
MNSSREGDQIDDFELDYVEMYVQELESQAAVWRDRFGFDEVAVGGSPEQGFRSVVLCQGAMKLVLTQATAEYHPAAAYVLAHGDGVANIALRTGDVPAAFAQVVVNGGRALAVPERHEGGDVAVSATVTGFGDVVHTLVQRRDPGGAGLPQGYRRLPTRTEPAASGDGDGLRLLAVDHFAVCVGAGELEPTVDFYGAALGFREIFAERIAVGSQAMLSKVLQSPSGTVTFTVLQPDPAVGAGQIDGFLKEHGGPGVQHIAFATEDAVRSVGTLIGRGVEFLVTPSAYYGLLADRVMPTKHALDDLRRLNILVDEDHAGQLFQIFTRSTHARRTLFFEVIERSGAETFGSSNIRALYEAVELEHLAKTGDR